MKKEIFYEIKDTLKPKFTMFDIQMAVGDVEFNKAKQLFDKGKVKEIIPNMRGFNAIVSGTEDYIVFIDANRFDLGCCNCYLGKKDVLCKHIIALAIASVFKYRPEVFGTIDIPLGQAVCNSEVRDINKEELDNVKSEINNAFKYIKRYSGPSKTWFAYQDSLLKANRLILYSLSNLTICKVSADLCIDIIVRLDKKLATVIDDSDGIIADLIGEIMELLSMFSKEDSGLKQYIIDKFPNKTNFGWKVEMIDYLEF